MANIFPKWTNALPIKAVVCLAVTVVFLAVGITYYCTQKYTAVGYQPIQSVAFSHEVHVGQLGMDCRYCHVFADVAAHASTPTTQSCMACHTQILPDSPRLAPVRESWKTGAPIRWTRIHKSPDFVYFNHAAHVNRGVGCTDCHGSVNQMPVVFQDKSLSMSWCLGCHRNPAPALRPPTDVFSPSPTPPSCSRQPGQTLRDAWKVNPTSNCGGCHR